MTKEQEEAIKECEVLKRCLIIYSDDIDNVKSGKAIETVLNMAKENKYIHKQLDEQQATINNYAKELEKYKKLYQIALDNTISSDRENMKKNKMIDLILEFLSERDLEYYTKEEGGEVLGIMRKYNKEDWKQYFERKVEDVNKKM